MQVKYWFTLNEPATFSIQGYNGFFSPAVPTNASAPYQANRVLLLAHANAYRLYNRKYKPMHKGELLRMKRAVSDDQLSK